MAESAGTSLAGRVVFISGGGGRIGGAACRAFAATAQSVREAGGGAPVVRTDVTSDHNSPARL
jgi:NAD(P)-dependent dehydrogenase (short-subunit alcohol dehydrogenase family)